MHLSTYTQKRTALGGETELSIVGNGNDEDINKLFATLWKEVFTFERSFSRFLPMSELSIFNRSAGQKRVISKSFKALLLKARELSIKTEGLYNPFILPALHRAGYVQSALPGYENDPQESYKNRAVVGIERLEIGDDWARIPYNTALDMGGHGKGYLADLLTDKLDVLWVKGYWLSLSGDIATKGVDEQGRNLSLAIQDAESGANLSQWMVECSKRYMGTATSGTFKRSGQADLSKGHHIINPKTGKPATTDINLATVCANSTVEADVLASCAVILGSERAVKFLKKQGARAGLLQCIDKKGKPFFKHFGSYITEVETHKTERAVHA